MMDAFLNLGTNFTKWDWAIIVAYVLATAGCGVYMTRYVKNVSDYVVAGRSLKSYLSIATMLGSEIGLVTVMYAAQKGLTGGLAALHIGFGAGLVALLIGLTGFLVVPMRRLEVMTIPEFYELRFSRGVRVYGAIILSLAGILNMGVFLKAAAVFVTGLTGMVDPNAVKIVITVLISLVLLYTILGGMLSVVITDYIQFVVLGVGLLITCALAVSKIGWTQIVDTVTAVHGAPGFNPMHGEGFGPDYILQQLLTAGLVSAVVWPTAMMRACSAKDAATVKRLYVWSSIGFTTRWMIPQFIGICALAYLIHIPEAKAFLMPDGVTFATGDKTLYAMPVFLAKILPTGMLGLVGAAMFSAFMSTHSSYLLCWSTVIVEDVVNPIVGGTLSDRARITISRVWILVIGVFLVVWSLWYPLEADLWDYLAVTAGVYFTGAIALLVFGLYWNKASSVGAYLALSCGVLCIFALAPVRRAFGIGETVFGIELTEPRIVLGTTALALVLMIAGSLAFPGKPLSQVKRSGFEVITP